MTEQVRFDGRVAIVTGAAQGLGKEFALLLGARGAHVIVNDIASIDSVVDEIRAAGGEAIAHQGDIGRRDTATRAVQGAIDSYGRLDILINNAGLLVLKTFEATDDDDLARTIDINIKGSWYLAHEAWPHMKAQRYGRILMVSSMNGVVFGTPDHAAYGLSKGALAGLTRELSFEGREHGINVNALMPGATTGMLNRLDFYDKPTISMSPALVAPSAGWLVHESCEETGLMVNSSSARIGRVVTTVSEGYQGSAEDFTLEDVRDHWGMAAATDDLSVVTTLEDYNAFRVSRFARTNR